METDTEDHTLIKKMQLFLVCQKLVYVIVTNL